MSKKTDRDASSDDSHLIPLCVDLDGTLIRTDILWESVVQLWLSPAVMFRAVWALMLRGKAAFKSVLAREVKIDPTKLPYRKEVLDFAMAQHQLGRIVVLATATHRIVAQHIADHLGIFSRVFATDETVNLSGASKRAALESAYGTKGFDYIGDNKKDLAIFSAAHKALLVNPSNSLLEKASAFQNVSQVFSDKIRTVPTIARALRIHQWAKNVLIVVPLLAAQLVINLQAWSNFLIAFLGFSFVASATYIINDLIDLQSDRVHPRKCLRPLASGELSIPAALLLSSTLGSIGFALSLVLLTPPFFVYLVVYVLLTLGYSFDLKRRLLVDVLALAVLYTLRILAGGAAVGVGVSEWLLMFSLFIFLSLAFLKRAIELEDSKGGEKMPGRGYSPLDLETMRIIGVSSGLISVLVFSLYIGSPVVTRLYRSPEILWLMCPLLIYWIARIWFLAARGEVHHDPVVFALRDPRSYAVVACGIAFLLLAKFSFWGTHL